MGLKALAFAVFGRAGRLYAQARPPLCPLYVWSPFCPPLCSLVCPLHCLLFCAAIPEGTYARCARAPQTALGVMLSFLLLHCLCVIATAAAIAALMPNPRAGALVGFFLYFALALPGALLPPDSLPVSGRLALCLLAPSGFSLGFRVINGAEVR